jgi:hypothetical protein
MHGDLRHAAQRLSTFRRAAKIERGFDDESAQTGMVVGVRWPRWLERKICRQRTMRPSLVG